MLFEVSLVSIEHAIEPWQQLLRTVVSVQHNRDAVQRSQSSDVVCSSDGASDAGFLVLVSDTLSGKVGCTALAGLEDDRAVLVASSLESSDDGGAGRDIDCRDGVVVLLSVLEEPQNIITDDTVGMVSNRFEDRHAKRAKGSTYTPSFRDKTLFAPGMMND